MRRFGRSAGSLLAVLVLLLIAAAIGYFVPAGPPLTGRATVVDGDTLRLDGERIRILGIDAPELEQDCTDASGAQWLCGEAARIRMAELLKGADIDCRPGGRDRYGRVLAHCSNGPVDLGQTMVRAGLAVADGDYFADEAQARNDKAGIWAGLFIQPVDWRRQHGIGAGGDGQGLWTAIRSWFR
ncbi:MAG: thermonuclease family protein [Devosia sp.]